MYTSGLQSYTVGLEVKPVWFRDLGSDFETYGIYFETYGLISRPRVWFRDLGSMFENYGIDCESYGVEFRDLQCILEVLARLAAHWLLSNWFQSNCLSVVSKHQHMWNNGEKATSVIIIRESIIITLHSEHLLCRIIRNVGIAYGRTSGTYLYVLKSVIMSIKLCHFTTKFKLYDKQAFREFLVSPALIRNCRAVISISFIWLQYLNQNCMKKLFKCLSSVCAARPYIW